MKTHLLIPLVIVMSIFSFGQISAQKIYISPTGNDTNSGTIEYPLASLTAARDKAREIRKNTQTSQPIEVIALEGEYFMIQPLFLTLDDAGTEINPLVFRSEEGRRAIFRGGVKLSGFEKVNDNLWKTFVPPGSLL